MTITTPITTQIEQAVQAIPGWSPLDQLMALFTLAYSSTSLEGDILELGSWCGRSAVALGMATKKTGRGKVHCIDLFPEMNDWYQNADGTYSFAVILNGKKYKAYADQTVWAEPFLRDIQPMYKQFGSTLDAFKSAIRANQLCDFVTPYRMDLADFSAQAPQNLKLSMAFIDGDHSFEAVSRDIGFIEQFLLRVGWICFDDSFSSYDGVYQAIQQHIIGSGRYKNAQQLTRKFFVAQRC